MKPRATLPCALALAWVFSLPFPALAHRVNIFAWAEAGTIHTESFFAGQRPARDCGVEARSRDGGQVLVRGRTDAAGVHVFPAPVPARDLLVVVNCGDGHRGEWPMAADEYAGAGSEAVSDNGDGGSSATVGSAGVTGTLAPPPRDRDPAAGNTAPLASSRLEDDPGVIPARADARVLRAIIAEELEKKLAPIRRGLARATSREPTFRDVAGGIGWLVGLAGMAAWAASRRNPKEKE